MNLFDINNKSSVCTGKLYRYREQSYSSGMQQLNKKITITPLKRISCSCEKCDWLLEELKENVDNSGYLPPITGQVKEGDKLRLNFTAEGSYWDDEVELSLYFTVEGDDNEET